MLYLKTILIAAFVIAGLLLIKTLVERSMRNMMDDYDSMLTNSEKSDAEDRKKNTYIFFPKK